MGDPRNSYTIPVNSYYPYVIPGATTESAGVMTADQAAMLPATENVEIYVGPSGNDSNDGSLSSPVLTLQKALALLPPGGWTKQCNIYALDGTVNYSGYAANTALPRPVGPDASPLAIIGGFTDELGTLTITAVGATALGQGTVTATVTPTTDEYRGAFLSFTSGAAAGRRYQIAWNDNVGTFTVKDGFDDPPSPGDTFVIERPSATINLTGELDIVNWGVLGLKGLKFTGSNLNYVGNVIVNHEGVQFNNILFVLAGAIAGTTNAARENFWSPAGSDNPFSASLRATAGVYFAAGSGNRLRLNNKASFIGSLLCTNARIGVSVNSYISLDTPNFLGRSIWTTAACYVETFSTTGASGEHVDGIASPISGLATWDLNDNTMAVLDALDISNSSVSGIAVSYGSVLEIAAVTSSTPNADYGIVVNYASNGFLFGGTTVSGGTADTQVGGTNKAYGALPYAEANALSSIQ